MEEKIRDKLYFAVIYTSMKPFFSKTIKALTCTEPSNTGLSSAVYFEISFQNHKHT